MANIKPKLVAFGAGFFVVALTLIVMISVMSSSKNKSNHVSTASKADKNVKTSDSTEKSTTSKKPTTSSDKVATGVAKTTSEIVTTTTESFKTAEEIFKENPDYNKDLDFIFNGIKSFELGRDISSGVMTVYGQNAFPLFVKQHYSSSSLTPIASAGRYGKGRFAAFSHSTCFVTTNASTFDNDQFMRNIVNWTLSSKPKAHIGICVYSTDFNRFHRVLSQQQFVTYSNISYCADQKLENVTYLKGFDLLILNDHNVKNNESEALRQYVASGGGLILGSTPWSHDPQSGYELFSNRILNLLGGAAFIINGYYHVESGPVTTLPRSNYNDTSAYQVWSDVKHFLHDNRSILSHDRLEQMKGILADRIKYAPMDKIFSGEMIDEYQLLLTNQTVNSTQYFPPTPTNALSMQNLTNILQRSKFIIKDKKQAEEMIQGVKTVVNSDFSIHSNILLSVLEYFYDAVSIRGTDATEAQRPNAN